MFNLRTLGCGCFATSPLITFFVLDALAFSATQTQATGLVYKEYFYEQPNYGGSPDKDAINSACLVKLDKPVIIENVTIKTAELLFSKEEASICGKLIGHRVEIKGTASDPITAINMAMP